MSLRICLQSEIINRIENGCFYKVAYKGNKPMQSMEREAPLTVWVNETSGTINNDIKKSSQAVKANFQSWNFEATVKFKHEVDTSTFVTEQFSGMVFNVDGVMAQVKVGSFTVQHPVTGGPASGTQLVMNLTATTRR